MKKYSIIFSFILLLAVAVTANAVTWDYNSVIGNGGYTSPYAGAMIIDFDSSLPAGWTISGNYQLTTGTEGDAAAPWYDNGSINGAKDLTTYLSVPKDVNQQPQSATISFGGSVKDYFGLWWGSMDTYNTFEFLDVDLNTVVATVKGDSFGLGNGNQNSPDTNKYVNFYGLGNFYGVRLTSTQYAFEIDNIAVGKNVVPEPATMMLIGLGLLGLAGARRKFKK